MVRRDAVKCAGRVAFSTNLANHLGVLGVASVRHKVLAQHHLLQRIHKLAERGKVQLVLAILAEKLDNRKRWGVLRASTQHRGHSSLSRYSRREADGCAAGPSCSESTTRCRGACAQPWCGCAPPAAPEGDGGGFGVLLRKRTSSR